MLSKKIMDKIEEFADPRFMEDWDNCGIQLGSNNMEVKRILLALDMSKDVCKKAVNGKYDMVITHHPFFFSGSKKIILDGYRGEIIRDLIKNDIVLYSAHTNLDITENGVNDVLCNILDINNQKPLVPSFEKKLVKIIVFVPAEFSYTEVIRNKMGESNFGKIGNYSYCSFTSDGIGRFKPEEDSNAFIGEIGRVESLEEEKIEFIVFEDEAENAIRTIKRVHPYEEVAYDIIPIKNKGKVFGHGRIGDLEKRISLEEYAKIIKERLRADSIRVYGNLDKKVKRIAICGGSGASFIRDAKRRGADLYITGDLKHHDAQIGRELGICLIDAGHYHTEIHVLKALKEYLDSLDEDLEIDIIEDNISRYSLI
ncbi:MAG: Nif3-like dinuclear metal center hexameric protein [Andreesenia angusta]|nr:Nif3-like dinuclear metal center hexameric protein [Andreesenia angusta]